MRPSAYDTATEVVVLERPEADWLPTGRWLLVGDAAVEAAWRGEGLPVPEGSFFVSLDEAAKSLETLLPWLRAWASLPLHRDATVVALGGGILTDMVGLAASLYLRGIAWHAWPTTLLAQVDAGIGGKTAVNLPEGKNLVGAFHPPARFVACRAFLDSLPPRQLGAGLWEVVKMAFLEGDVAWADTLLTNGLPGTEDLTRALRLKVAVVNRDPHERGERRLLNLGHTLGHALESASGHALLHGEAVGLGLLAACHLAETQGHPSFPPGLKEALAARLAPLAPHVPAWEACLPWLLRDKKALHGARAIHCILPRPGARAAQVLLPAEAWQPAHARLLADLT
jgi:3-dehydroquinate synthase